MSYATKSPMIFEVTPINLPHPHFIRIYDLSCLANRFSICSNDKCALQCGQYAFDSTSVKVPLCMGIIFMVFSHLKIDDAYKYQLRAQAIPTGCLDDMIHADNGDA